MSPIRVLIKPLLHLSKRMVSAAASQALKESVKKSITLDTLNPQVIELQYAVRGPLLQRAYAIESEIKKGVTKPYKEIIMANIGDCHAMGQTPITFIRQVLTSCIYPELLKSDIIPADAKERAKSILSSCRSGSLGAYSPPLGLEVVRKQVAKYIENRDGLPSDWQNVVLCAGASYGIRNLLKLFSASVNGKPAGVMVPIPQYPLYSASIVEYNMKKIGYYLDESNKWALNVKELERAIGEGRSYSNPRVIVVLNPGNPTGGVLSRNIMEDVIKFAYKENLFIFADEVYQNNIYEKGLQFHSFKKVMTEMGKPYSDMELSSYMSVSKGYMGEAGIRGGYHEIVNMDPEAFSMYKKVISIIMCPSTAGQATLSSYVSPPEKGEPSYEQFIEEKEKVLNSLKLRGEMVTEKFNTLPGYTCNPVQGAMYAFPQIKMPPKAIEAAKKVNQPADVFYAFQILEEEGICLVPGSGFGQQPGTYHYRTTILPLPDQLKVMLDKIEKFHARFMQKYG